MGKKLHDYRRSYEKGMLDIDNVVANPTLQFEQWFHEAETTALVDEPNAMTLSSVGVDGFPKGRVVLLKEFNQEGFVFYTNYASDKGKSLAHDPKVCLSFFWAGMERQIIIKGLASKISEEKSSAYFSERPRASQLGALVSDQSSVIENREALEAQLAALDAKYEGKEIPKPKHWGGYVVKPSEFEFWQGRRSRLHDRIRYTKTNEANWKIERLQP